MHPENTADLTQRLWSNCPLPTLWYLHLSTQQAGLLVSALVTNSKWDIISPSGKAGLSSTSNIRSRFNCVSAPNLLFRNDFLSNVKILWGSQKTIISLFSWAPCGLTECWCVYHLCLNYSKGYGKRELGCFPMQISARRVLFFPFDIECETGNIVILKDDFYLIIPAKIPALWVSTKASRCFGCYWLFWLFFFW